MLELRLSLILIDWTRIADCLFTLFLMVLLSFSEAVTSYAHHLEKRHDMLLGMLFDRGTYKKVYSYRHLINGFAVHITPEQVILSAFFNSSFLHISLMLACLN